MPHIDRPIEPITRQLEINSTAQRALTFSPLSPQKPVICDEGHRAGWFAPDIYYCAECQIVLRCFPHLGRIEYSRKQWEDGHFARIDAATCEASTKLEPESPEIY